MSVRDFAQKNTTLFVLSLLLSGFLSGIVTYKFILEIPDKYILKSDYDSIPEYKELMSKYELLETESKSSQYKYEAKVSLLEDSNYNLKKEIEELQKAKRFSNKLAGSSPQNHIENSYTGDGNISTNVIGNGNTISHDDTEKKPEKK